MLMLIAKEAGERLSYLNFNTSHVNVNPHCIPKYRW